MHDMGTEDKDRHHHHHQLGHVLMQRYAGLSTNINQAPIQYSCHLWNTTQPKLPNVLCQEYRDLLYSLYISPYSAYIIYSLVVCCCQRNSSQNVQIEIAQTRSILILLLRKLETKSSIFLDITWQVGICQNTYQKIDTVKFTDLRFSNVLKDKLAISLFHLSDAGTCR